MKLVKENLYNFQKTGDVKSSLKIGYKNRIFDNTQDLIDFVILNLTKILGTKEIPKDIIDGSAYYINPIYVSLIENFITENNIKWVENEYTLDKLGYSTNFFKNLHYILKSMGFKR